MTKPDITFTYECDKCGDIDWITYTPKDYSHWNKPFDIEVEDVTDYYIDTQGFLFEDDKGYFCKDCIDD